MSEFIKKMEEDENAFGVPPTTRRETTASTHADLIHHQRDTTSNIQGRMQQHRMQEDRYLVLVPARAPRAPVRLDALSLTSGWTGWQGGAFPATPFQTLTLKEIR